LGTAVILQELQTLNCALHTTREINAWLKDAARQAALDGSSPEVVLQNPDSRHNLAVGLMTPLRIRIDGPVGYYCAGLCDGIEMLINGGCGWGLAENLMGGTVHLKGSAGSAAGATMRGGLIVIEGDAGARCGAAMKGGTLVVHGDVGFMTGFMMQKGTMIIGGDAGEALGDSLYEGKIYLRGNAENLGSDAVQVDMTEDDATMLQRVLVQAKFDAKPADFKKIESGKRLYNFDTKEKEIWKNAM
jgi:glutamate synthase domain-containing protein 3